MGNYNGSLLSPVLGQDSIAEGGSDLGGMIALPPGGKVFFVRGNGTTITTYSDDPAGFAEKLSPSVAKALTYCVSGRGDRVVALRGHTESISAASAWPLVAGVSILGMGTGTSRPTFTWDTSTAATVLMNAANVTIQNCILNLSPAASVTLVVAAPITISAAGCRLIGNQIRVSASATSKTTIGITTTAAADDLEMDGNEVIGDTAGEVTTCIQFVGADRLKFRHNTVVAATSAATVGVIRFLTTASLDIKMFHNAVRNNKTAGATDQAITGMAGLSGEVDFLHMVVLGNAAANLTDCFSTPASLAFGRQVYVSNNIAERAALFGVECA